jgi:hypothetical protein
MNILWKDLGEATKRIPHNSLASTVHCGERIAPAGQQPVLNTTSNLWSAQADRDQQTEEAH